MIILEIKEYCHHCPNFTVEHKKDIVQCGFDTVEIGHKLTCTNKGTCEALLAYLKEEKKNERNTF